MEEIKKTPENTFSEETMQSLRELGEVIRPILHRLIEEGKAKVVDGKVIFLKDKNKN